MPMRTTLTVNKDAINLLLSYGPPPKPSHCPFAPLFIHTYVYFPTKDSHPISDPHKQAEGEAFFYEVSNL